MNAPKFYTYQQIAAVLSVSVRTVYTWFRHRPRFRCGNTVRIPEAEVERFLFQSSMKQVAKWHKPGRKPGRKAGHSKPDTPSVHPGIK